MDLVGLLKSQFLCHLVFCYVFIASGLIVNTLQLCTLVLWPIDKQLFRRLNCRLSYCISSRKCLLLSLLSLPLSPPCLSPLPASLLSLRPAGRIGLLQAPQARSARYATYIFVSVCLDVA